MSFSSGSPRVEILSITDSHTDRTIFSRQAVIEDIIRQSTKSMKRSLGGMGSNQLNHKLSGHSWKGSVFTAMKIGLSLLCKVEQIK